MEKALANARLMASLPLESRSTGAVADIMMAGDRAAPHHAARLRAPRSAATFGVVGDGVLAGQRLRRTQDASEMMPQHSMHAALVARPHGRAGAELRRRLRAASAHANPCGLTARSTHRQRAGASALRRTFEHECANVCRSSKYASVVSVIGMYQTYGLHTLRVAAIDFTLPVLTPCFWAGFDTR